MADTTGTERILKCFSALKANWPLKRTPQVPLTKNVDVPVPPVENRRRIHGRFNSKPLDPAFLDAGFNDLKCVINIAEVFGLKFGGNTTILDWGVGCGRLIRHIPKHARSNCVGMDVDPINIDWCRKNIPFGRYEVIDPYTSTSSHSANFDLIYGYSVMTHLGKSDQDRWLAEINRISRGLIILSVHGVVSAAEIALWARDSDLFQNWLESGFIDAPIPNPDISDVTDHDYYRDVAHTSEYIKDHWSMFFDVLEIIPGGFGKIHDAVVGRARH